MAPFTKNDDGAMSALLLLHCLAVFSVSAVTAIVAAIVLSALRIL